MRLSCVPASLFACLSASHLIDTRCHACLRSEDGSFQPNSVYYKSIPVGTIMAYSVAGTISQTLMGVSLQPNSTYTLSV